jgi:hypothetical protein
MALQEGRNLKHHEEVIGWLVTRPQRSRLKKWIAEAVEGTLTTILLLT